MSFDLPALNLLTLRLAQTLGDICRAVAERGGRDHSLIPLVNMAWNRINKTRQRFERLLAGIAAGRKAPVRKPGGTRAATPRDPAAFRLPRHFCWLVVRMPETASLASQLKHWLGEKEITALLAAEPRAVRILRPMCRMLGVAHPAIGLREPASAGPAKVRRPAPAARPADIRPAWGAAWAPVAAPVPAAPARPARWVVWRRSD